MCVVRCVISPKSRPDLLRLLPVPPGEWFSTCNALKPDCWRTSVLPLCCSPHVPLPGLGPPPPLCPQEIIKPQSSDVRIDQPTGVLLPNGGPSIVFQEARHHVFDSLPARSPHLPYLCLAHRGDSIPLGLQRRDQHAYDGSVIGISN